MNGALEYSVSYEIKIMDKKSFLENYKVSRGQLDRLLAKAAKAGGRFFLDGCGWFTVEKRGRGKMAPVEIVPERAEARRIEPAERELPAMGESPLESLKQLGYKNLAQMYELLKLDKSEIDKLKGLAEIEKIQQTTLRYRREVRAEAFAELLPIVAEALSPLRHELEELRLPREALDRLRGALLESLDRLRKASFSDDCG